MYGFKYIEGFDPSIPEYSNPHKAGSIKMPTIKYNQPFTQRDTYPIVVNPGKAGSIPYKGFQDTLILKDRNVTRVKPRTYQKLQENTPFSVNLVPFTSKEPIMKKKIIKIKETKTKTKTKTKTGTKEGPGKPKLADAFDEEFKKMSKMRTKLSKDEIKREILKKYKPINVTWKTKFSKKQINASGDIRKKVITNFSKKANLAIKRLYIKGHKGDAWSQHASSDKKELDKWTQGFENMYEGHTNIMEGNANIVINPVLPDLTKLDEYEGEDFLGDFFSGSLEADFYDTGVKPVTEGDEGDEGDEGATIGQSDVIDEEGNLTMKTVNSDDAWMNTLKVLNDLNSSGELEHTCTNIDPTPNSSPCPDDKCRSDGFPKWCGEVDELTAYNPQKQSHNQLFLNESSSCKVKCNKGYSSKNNTICNHTFDGKSFTPIITPGKCLPNCKATIAEHVKQNNIINWEMLTGGENKSQSYKSDGDCPKNIGDFGGLRTGDTCSPICADGYEKKKIKDSSCKGKNDTSVLNPSICYPKKCELPNSINYGSINSCNETESGGICLPKCDPGYMAIPSTCIRGIWKNKSSKGLWRELKPSCVPIICKKPSQKDNEDIYNLYKYETICVSNDEGKTCKEDSINLTKEGTQLQNGIYFHKPQRKNIGNCFLNITGSKINGNTASIHNCIGEHAGKEYHWHEGACYRQEKTVNGEDVTSDNCNKNNYKWFSKGILKNRIKCTSEGQRKRGSGTNYTEGGKVIPYIACDTNQSYSVNKLNINEAGLNYTIDYKVLGCEPRICDATINQGGRSLQNKAFATYESSENTEKIYNEWNKNANKRKIKTDITIKCKDGHKTLFTNNKSDNDRYIKASDRKQDRRKYVCSFDDKTGAKFKPWTKEISSCHEKGCSMKINSTTTNAIPTNDNCQKDTVLTNTEAGDYIKNGKTCPYACKNGYIMREKNEPIKGKEKMNITCNLGKWTDGTSTRNADTDVTVDFGCKEKNCDVSNVTIQNGTKGTCKDILLSGKTCSPRCNAGYTLDGGNNKGLSCLRGATNIPSCKEVPCNSGLKVTMNNPKNENKNVITNKNTKLGSELIVTNSCKDNNTYSIGGKKEQIKYVCTPVKEGVSQWKLFSKDHPNGKLIQNSNIGTQEYTCRRSSCFIENKGGKSIVNTQTLIDKEAIAKQKTSRIMKVTYSKPDKNKTLTTKCSGIGDCYYQCAAGYKLDTGATKFNNKDNIGIIRCGGAKGFTEGSCIPRPCNVQKDMNVIKHNNATSGEFLKKNCSGSFVTNSTTLIKHDGQCNFSCNNGYRLSGDVKDKYTTTYKCSVKNTSPTNAVNKMVVIPNKESLQCIPFTCPKPNTPGYKDGKNDLPNKISLKSTSGAKLITNVDVKCNSKYLRKTESNKPRATCERSKKDDKKYTMDGCKEGICKNNEMTQPTNTASKSFTKKIDQDETFTCKKGFSTDGKFKRYKDNEKLGSEKTTTAKCTKKGVAEVEWKSSSSCNENKCEAPTKDSTWNMKSGCSFEPNKSCSFECKNGYKYVDNWNDTKNPLQCKEGEWRAKGTNNIVIPTNNCTAKECIIKYSNFTNNFKNGHEGDCKVTKKNNKKDELIINSGKSCTPVCNSGYELSGGDAGKYKCELGNLSETNYAKEKKLQCRPIICPKPNTPGYKDGKNDLPNKISLKSTSGAKLITNVDVKCNGTYLRKNKDKAPTLECKINNQTYKLDGCEEGVCKNKMTQPIHTDEKSFTKKINQDETFTCKQGFSTDGKFKRYNDNKSNLGNEKYTVAKCTKKGDTDVEWKSSTQCNENKCEAPTTNSIWSITSNTKQSSGKYNVCNFSTGKSCITSCKSGYRFVKGWDNKKNPLICIHGEWREKNSKKSDKNLDSKIVRPEKICVPFSCNLNDKINKIDNGGFTKCSTNDFESSGKLKHGSTCGVTCNAGFKLSNTKHKNYKCSINDGQNIMSPISSAAKCVPVSCGTLTFKRKEGGKDISDYKCVNTNKDSTCSPTCKDKEKYSIDGINGSVTYKCVGISEGNSKWQIQGNKKDTKNITCKRTSCFYFKDKNQGGKHINFTREYGKAKDGLKVKTYTKSDNNTLKTILSGWGTFDYQCAPGYYLSSKSTRKSKDKDDIGVVTCGQGKGVFSDAECVPRPCKIDDTLNKSINNKITDSELFNIDQCTNIYNNKNKQINHGGICDVACKYGTLLNGSHNTKYKCSINEKGQNIMVLHDNNKGKAQCKEINCDSEPTNKKGYNDSSLPKKENNIYLSKRNPKKKTDLFEYPVNCSNTYVRKDSKSKRPRATCDIKGIENRKQYSLSGCVLGKCKKGVIKEPVNVKETKYPEKTIGQKYDFQCKQGYSINGNYGNNSSKTSQTCSKTIRKDEKGKEILNVPQTTEWKTNKQCQENKCRPTSSSAIGSVPGNCNSNPKDKCKIECKTGYRHTSNWNQDKEVYCKEGIWRDATNHTTQIEDPKVKCELNSCNLNDSDNKNVKISNGKIVCKGDQYEDKSANKVKGGGTCKVECNDGYKLLNENSVYTCNVNSNGKNTLIPPQEKVPKCEKVNCRTLTATIYEYNAKDKKIIKRNDNSCNKRGIGETCDFTCSSNYKINGTINKNTYICSGLKGGKSADKDEDISQWKINDTLVPKDPTIQCKLGKCFAGGNKYMVKIDNTVDLKNKTEQNKETIMKHTYSNGVTQCDGIGKCYFQCPSNHLPYVDKKKINSDNQPTFISCGGTKPFQEATCVPNPCNVSKSVVSKSIYENCQGKQNNMVLHGKTCNIKCNTNYRISGTTTYRCDKGTMKVASGSAAKCTPLVCNQKPNSTTGYSNIPISVSKITHKDGKNVDCASKYLLSSQPKAICNKDYPKYTLSGCSLGKCSNNKPKDIKSIDTSKKEINDTQDFTCKDKYSTDGKKASKNTKTTQKCIRSNDKKSTSWIPVKKGETCSPNGCYNPTSKDNWSWIKGKCNNIQHGKQCYFQCNPGYKYVSSWNSDKGITCNLEEWKIGGNVINPNTKCEKKSCDLKDNDNKITISNGNIVCPDDQYKDKNNKILKAGGSCNVECNPGYRLLNEKEQFTCGIKNKKNVLIPPTKLPKCVRVDCRQFKASINTLGKKKNYTCPNNQITNDNNTCVIKCANNFSIKPSPSENTLVNKNTYICTALKGGKSKDKDHEISQWKQGNSIIDKDPSIDCKRKSCFIIKDEGGMQIKNTVKLANTVYQKQNTSGNNVLRTPQKNGNPTNGITTCSGVGKCYFQCKPGYAPYVGDKKYTDKEKLPKGGAVITCGGDKNYQKGECREADCDISNYTLGNGTKGQCEDILKHGEKCGPSCNTGYIFKDDKKQLECNKGVLKEKLQCSSITCSKPSSDTENYKYKGEAMPDTLQRIGYDFPETKKDRGINLTCSTNYRISSQPLATCEKPGKYSQSGCVPAKCVPGKPKQPDNTNSSNYGTKYNATQEFTCNQGYSKDKDGKVTKITKKCDKGSDKEIPQKMIWKNIKQGESQECLPNNCVNPGKGVKWKWNKCVNMSHSKTCSFECKPGYKLKGGTNTTLKCLKGVWTQGGKQFDPDTTCEPRKCSETFSLNKGAKGNCDVIEGKVTLNHNSSCTPTCNSKYELSGGDNKQYKCSLGNLTEKKMNRKLQCIPIVCPKPKSTGGYVDVPNSVSQTADNKGTKDVKCQGIRINKDVAPKATCTGDSSKPYTLSGCKVGECYYRGLSKPNHGTNNEHVKKVKANARGKIGDAFTFTCDKGYETILKDDNKKTSTTYKCVKKGTGSTEWKKNSDEIKSCVGKLCKIKKSDLPDHIDTSKSTCKVGQVLKHTKTCGFTCATGYKLEPGTKNTLTCNAENITKQGTCVEQGCIKDLMQYGLKGNCTIQSEKIHIDSGESCSPRCINGYKIVKNDKGDKIVCLRSKTNVLQCDPVKCPVLTVIKRKNMKQECKGLKTGETCKVVCPSGFTINGTGAKDRTYQCNGTGYGTSQWNIGKTTDDLQCKRTSCFRKSNQGGITISNTDSLQGGIDTLQKNIKNVSHKYTNRTTTTCSGNGKCYYQCKKGFSAFVDGKKYEHKDNNNKVVKGVGLVTCGGDKDGFGKAECKENPCTLSQKAGGEFKQGSCENKRNIDHGTTCDLTCKDDEYISNEDDNKKEIGKVEYKCDKGTMNPLNQTNNHFCKAILCTPPSSTDGYNVQNIDVKIQGINSDTTKNQIKKCNTGFQGTGKIQACSKHGQPYMLSGCNHNTCTKPSSTQGYKLASNMSLLQKEVEGAKYKPSCDTNWYSNAKGNKGKITKCNAHNKPYSLSECKPNCKKTTLSNTVKNNKNLKNKNQILGENIIERSDNRVNELQKDNSTATFQCKPGYGVNVSKEKVFKEQIGESYKCKNDGTWENTKKCEKLCNENMPGGNSVEYRGCENKSVNEQCQYWKCAWTKPTNKVGKCITKGKGNYGVCKIDTSKCKSPNQVINGECIAIKEECDKINGAFIPNAMLDKQNCETPNKWDENKLVNINGDGIKTCIHWPGANTHTNKPGYGLNEYRTEMGHILQETHNYCRNPNQRSQGIWCFTRNKHIRYGDCKKPTKKDNFPQVPSNQVTLASMQGKLAGSKVLTM